jgi:hypothetical protein
MARDVITEDTQVMGEVFITLRDADGGVTARENRVSIPHLWEATLFYLTTMALSEPTRFDFDRRALPAAMTPPPGTVPRCRRGRGDGRPLRGAHRANDAGMVAMDAAVVADAGAAMDAAVTAPPADDGCGCAVPGRAGGMRGWLGASVLGLWVMTRRRRPRA